MVSGCVAERTADMGADGIKLCGLWMNRILRNAPGVDRLRLGWGYLTRSTAPARGSA